MFPNLFKTFEPVMDPGYSIKERLPFLWSATFDNTNGAQIRLLLQKNYISKVEVSFGIMWFTKGNIVSSTKLR